MELLRNVLAECSLLLKQGGPVLWAIIAVAVWLYTTLAKTWSAVMPIEQEIKKGLVAEGEDRREIVRDYAIFELKKLAWVERRLPVIGVMVSVCSLGGLLGTVSGMLETFSNMATQGKGDVMERIASGISEAMITTQVGLLVAIPAALMFVLLRSRVQAVHQQLEKCMHSDLAQFYQSENR